ncbi:hypothetical protein Ctha_1741 [Chloroherpeton thalassium ATCC 35110]|uniref:Uncharacterized protein n=1 Tax=Chloroherpeton thalassium (strain ATCC 35110 / GB-78) TaxID=517418 RepID=B3QT99_CHLT3|nr:hypothetical protein [Chloroherpeton thalassium]ACF14198.1 hypothetical protein Ctha_1741 [Chloroherpeton thalassium ATCC 35110]
MSSKEELKQLLQQYSEDGIQLEELKAEQFFQIVQDKYHGDLHRALLRAIDYFLMYEKSASLKNVADTIEELRSKISNIRQMNADLSSTLKTINEKTEKIKAFRDQQQENHPGEKKDDRA